MKLLTLVVGLLLAPVTAGQQPATISPADASLREFLLRWEAAQVRFINGDGTQWAQLSSQADDVTILGGFGGFGEKGWSQVGPRYQWAASQYRANGATLTVEYVNVGVSGDLAFTVGIERQSGVRVGNQPAAQRTLRATQVFRRENGAWKLLHRHADQMVEKQGALAKP